MTKPVESVRPDTAAPQATAAYPALGLLVLILGWIIAAALLFASHVYMLPVPLLKIGPRVLVFMLAVLSIYYAGRGVFSRDHRTKLSRPWAIAILCTTSMVFTVIVDSSVELLESALRLQSETSWTKGRNQLLEQPQLFPEIEKLAHQFGVTVRLGDFQDSWAMTSLRTRGTSPASLSFVGGLCRLNMNSPAVIRWSRSDRPSDAVLWIHAVMVHELAHCIDGMPKQPTSQKAREVYADVFLVGYLRLTQTDSVQTRLIDVLQRYRARDSVQDPAHATMCWINRARREPLALSVGDLPQWTRRVRVGAPCKL